MHNVIGLSTSCAIDYASGLPWMIVSGMIQKKVSEYLGNEGLFIASYVCGCAHIHSCIMCLCVCVCSEPHADASADS